MVLMSGAWWWIRFAWGCGVTLFMLFGGGDNLGHAPMDRPSVWLIVVLIGWGPLLFLLSLREKLWAAWGWCASLGIEFLAESVFSISSTARSCLILVVAWGPLLRPIFMQEWRSWGFKLGATALRDKSGRKADWTFSSAGLEVAVDLARKEFRLRAQSARWQTGSGDWSVGPVEMSRPLFECELTCEAITVSVHHHVTAQVMGVTGGGNLAIGTVLTGESVTTEEPTGKYKLNVVHRDASWEVQGVRVRRRADGSIENYGSVNKKVVYVGGPKLSVEILDLPKKVGARLGLEWEAAKRMIAELEKTFEADLLAKRKAEAEDAFLRDESTARERWAFAKESARRQVDELRAKSAVGGEFLDMGYGQDGMMRWALAADREGRAAIMDQTERWSGSLAKARARATVEVAQKGAAGNADTLELVVELDDPEFERERLAKRRFRIMRGCPRDKLLAWADRIQILAGQDSQPSEATS